MVWGGMLRPDNGIIMNTSHRVCKPDNTGGKNRQLPTTNTRWINMLQLTRSWTLFPAACNKCRARYEWRMGRAIGDSKGVVARCGGHHGWG